MGKRTRKILVAYRLDAAVVAGLKRVKDRDGTPQSFQVDRALREWLHQRGVLAPVASPSAMRPDSDGQPDWPKKTADIDVDGRPVRRAKKGGRQ